MAFQMTDGMEENQYADLSSVDEQERRKQLELKALTEMEDLQYLMRLQQGRRMFWKLLSDAGVFQSSMTGNSWTYFKEGQRNFGLKLWSRLQTAAPNEFAMMQQENGTGSDFYIVPTEPRQKGR